MSLWQWGFILSNGLNALSTVVGLLITWRLRARLRLWLQPGRDGVWRATVAGRVDLQAGLVGAGLHLGAIALDGGLWHYRGQTHWRLVSRPLMRRAVWRAGPAWPAGGRRGAPPVRTRPNGLPALLRRITHPLRQAVVRRLQERARRQAVVQAVLGALHGRVRLGPLRFHGQMGLGDAMATALACGALQVSASVAVRRLVPQVVRQGSWQIRVYPAYGGQRVRLRSAAVIQVRAFWLALALFRALAALVRPVDRRPVQHSRVAHPRRQARASAQRALA